MIDRLVDAGIPADRCRVLGVARQNYYKQKRTPTTRTQLRRQWLTGLIREIHVASRGTYGYRRVHAELTRGMGLAVCERTVWLLMNQAGVYGPPGPTRVKRLRGVVTADDLVIRKLHRLRPNELWVTDITQHRTREGWIYCAAVLDPYSRRIVGWSIDSKQDATLVVNALDMAIRNRRPEPGGIVHADHGTQFTSWVFGEKIRSDGLLPSFGTVGDGLDNAMMESFWSSMQIELLNRKKWKTRVELANAIFEYIEISTIAADATPHSATARRSSSNYSPRTTPSPQSVATELEPKRWSRSSESASMCRRWKMFTMPKAFPKEFREDVVRVYKDSDSPVAQVAKDFGISPSCLKRWLTIDERRSSQTSSRSGGEADALREANKRIKLLEQGERGPAPCGGVSVTGKPAGKLMYPLVRELAAGGVPVAVTCRVLNIARQPYYRWRPNRGCQIFCVKDRSI